MFEEMGKKQEALESYTKAVQVKPDFFVAFNNKGLLLDTMGNHREAIEEYDRALKIKADFDAAWFNKASAYALLSNEENTLVSLRKAVELNPQYKDLARKNPDFLTLSKNPEFKKLVSE